MFIVNSEINFHLLQKCLKHVHNEMLLNAGAVHMCTDPYYDNSVCSIGIYY